MTTANSRGSFSPAMRRKLVYGGILVLLSVLCLVMTQLWANSIRSEHANDGGWMDPAPGIEVAENGLVASLLLFAMGLYVIVIGCVAKAKKCLTEQ